jgi:hypothetical protein
MTEKEIFEVVKYFKDIYTTINNGEVIHFSGLRFFYVPNPHYLLHGKLEASDNAFIKWLSSGEKNFSIKMSDLDDLRDCLKKNVVSIDASDLDFKLTYKDRDLNEKVFSCKHDDTRTTLSDRIDSIIPMMVNVSGIDGSLIENMEILEIYNENGKVTNLRNSDKIVEIPVKRIISFFKDSENSIRFSDKRSEGHRYVELTGKNKLLSLSQLFATI